MRDGGGELIQRCGVTPAPGLYTLGLRFQHRRSSHTIGGVGHDARLLAARIVAGRFEASDPSALAPLAAAA